MLWYWPCRSLERSDIDHADHSNALILTRSITSSLKNSVICSAWGTHESILHPCTAELAVMTSMCMSKIINLHTTIKSFQVHNLLMFIHKQNGHSVQLIVFLIDKSKVYKEITNVLIRVTKPWSAFLCLVYFQDCKSSTLLQQCTPLWI